MKNYIIKLLGGHTKEEMDIICHCMEDASKLLKNKIDKLENNRHQLNQIFFHLSDALHNFSEKNENPNYVLDEAFGNKMRAVFRNLRILAEFNPARPDDNRSDYQSIEHNLFEELKSFISCNLFIAVTTFEFSDESFEQFNYLFNRLLPKNDLVSSN